MQKKENLEKNEIQNIIKNELSNYPTKNEINMLNAKIDELLKNQGNLVKEIRELKSQKQKENDINDNDLVSLKKINVNSFI